MRARVTDSGALAEREHALIQPGPRHRLAFCPVAGIYQNALIRLRLAALAFCIRVVQEGS
jgi:hypothetical protein